MGNAGLILHIKSYLLTLILIVFKFNPFNQVFWKKSVGLRGRPEKCWVSEDLKPPMAGLKICQ
jgi:hypothetical protein